MNKCFWCKGRLYSPRHELRFHPGEFACSVTCHAKAELMRATTPPEEQLEFDLLDEYLNKK